MVPIYGLWMPATDVNQAVIPSLPVSVSFPAQAACEIDRLDQALAPCISLPPLPNRGRVPTQLLKIVASFPGCAQIFQCHFRPGSAGVDVRLLVARRQRDAIFDVVFRAWLVGYQNSLTIAD
jgi:hypothetical protein